MGELRVNIRHVMLKEFKIKNATKTSKKFPGVYGQRVLIDCQVRNWVSKFRCSDASVKDEHRPGRSLDLDQDVVRELVECNTPKCPRELALDLNTLLCNLPSLENIGIMSQLSIWLPRIIIIITSRNQHGFT